mgnify:FL=1
MFQNILAATETPLYCDECVRSALRIAEKEEARVFILHVLESDNVMYRNYVRHFKTGEKIVADDDYIRAVEGEIDAQCSAVSRMPSNCHVKVKPGVPWEEILKFVKRQNIDLVLMNARARKSKKERFGSTLGGVIRRERCPICLVNQFPSTEQLKFKKVMVGLDFSPSCQHALRFAATLADAYGATLHLLHVIQNQTESTTDPSPRDRMEALSRTIAETIPKELALVEGAKPHLEILSTARDLDIDLLVMGSHTKRTGTEWYIGSVVEQVSTRSACPVVVITDPKAVKRWSEASA